MEISRAVPVVPLWHRSDARSRWHPAQSVWIAPATMLIHPSDHLCVQITCVLACVSDPTILKPKPTIQAVECTLLSEIFVLWNQIAEHIRELRDTGRDKGTHHRHPHGKSWLAFPRKWLGRMEVELGEEVLRALHSPVWTLKTLLAGGWGGPLFVI